MTYYNTIKALAIADLLALAWAMTETIIAFGG
jgi:hypothetical protein